MSDMEPFEERIVALENLVTHLERTLDALHSVLLDQRKEIDTLKRIASRLDERIARLDDEDEPRDPAGDRPPHY